MSGFIGQGSKSGIIGAKQSTSGLSDYEEGSWTAGITTGAGAASMSVADCRYTKIGRVVHLTGAIQTSSHSGSGVCYVTGIPFSTDGGNDMNSRSAGSISAWGFTGSPTNDFHAVIFSSSNTFYIQDQGANDVGAHVDGDTEFRFQLTYIVSVTNKG